MTHEITHEQLKQIKRKFREVLDIIDPVVAAKRTPKRKEPEEETPVVPVVVPSTSCIGRPWTEPPTPCQGGPKSHETKGILFNGKREIACKECFNARERFKAQQKKLKKDDDN